MFANSKIYFIFFILAGVSVTSLCYEYKVKDLFINIAVQKLISLFCLREKSSALVTKWLVVCQFQVNKFLFIV